MPSRPRLGEPNTAVEPRIREGFPIVRRQHALGSEEKDVAALADSLGPQRRPSCRRAGTEGEARGHASSGGGTKIACPSGPTISWKRAAGAGGFSSARSGRLGSVSGTPISVVVAGVAVGGIAEGGIVGV